MGKINQSQAITTALILILLGVPIVFGITDFLQDRQIASDFPSFSSYNFWVGTGEQLWQSHWGSDYSVVLQDWKETLNRMDKWNFNTIRVRIVPSDFERHQELIDMVFDEISNRGMKVIFDLHNYNGDDGYFGSAKWKSDWQKIATKYKNDKRIDGYELWNEPFMTDSWASSISSYSDIWGAYATCTQSIRAIDSSKTIIWGDPLLSNSLPVEDGFLGRHGDILSQYASWDITFALHRYPPIDTDPAKAWTGISWVWKATDYLKGLGFGVWLGEFGPLNGVGGGDYSVAENKAFVVQCINGCLQRNVGFALWEYRVDHYEYSGFYDDCLEESNYTP